MERRFKVVLRELVTPVVGGHLVASFLEVDMEAESASNAMLDALQMYAPGYFVISVTEVIKVPS